MRRPVFTAARATMGFISSRAADPAETQVHMNKSKFRNVQSQENSNDFIVYFHKWCVVNSEQLRCMLYEGDMTNKETQLAKHFCLHFNVSGGQYCTKMSVTITKVEPTDKFKNI